MKLRLTTTLFATTLAAAAALSMGKAIAQDWGPQVSANDVHPKIKDLGNALGMIRSTELFFGQLNLIEIVGSGRMVDIEVGTLGEPVEVSRFTYAASFYFPASRLDYEGPNLARKVRVVRGERAWDEEAPGVNPTDASNAVLRRAQIFLLPHAFARAAAFGDVGKCPDGNECQVSVEVSEENGKTLISLPIYDIPYTATLGEDNRPERIEADVPMPDGSTKTIIATFASYRNGDGIGEALDKFHSGTYFPASINHEIDGTKVLEITVEEGWSNPYVIFPEPEKLTQAKQ